MEIMQNHQEKKTVLTVGLITKNEEKNIEKCLQCLQPLRQQLGAKIIVGDTGSTDRTVEIAQQYADEVFSMEWKNDFAYARNQVLARANSEWYLSVDADEWLQDATELIDFFNSSNYKQYKTAHIGIKSYTYSENSKEQVISDIFYALRLVKCEPDRKFVGKIHEAFVPKPPKITLKKTIFDHYGYFYKGKLGAKKAKLKNIRNGKALLEELKFQPENIRLYSHAMDTYRSLKEYLKLSQDFDKAIYNNIALRENIFFKPAICKAILGYVLNNYWEDANRLCDLAIECMNNSLRVHFVLYYKIYVLSELGITDDIRRLFEQYLLERKRVLDDNYQSEEWELTVSTKCLPEEVLVLVSKVINSLMDYEDEEPKIPEQHKEFAIWLAEQIEVEKLYKNNFTECVKFLLALQKKNLDILPVLEKCFCCQDDEETEDDSRIEMAEALLSKAFFQMEKEQRLEIAKLSVENKTVKCYKIYAMENFDLAKEYFIHLTEQVKEWEKAPKVIYALAFERCWPLPQEAWNIPYEEIHATVCWLMETKEPFYQQLVNYLNTYPVEKYNITLIERDVRLLYASLKGKIVVDEDTDDEETIANVPAKEVVLQLWNRYFDVNHQFIQQIYQPETMTEEHLALYPMDVRVQFYFEKIKDCLDKKDYLQALKYLKDVVRQDKGMKKLVDVLFDEIAEMKKEQERAENEFFRIAEQLKKYIKELVSFGEVEQAKNALKQLLALSPNDEEAKSLLWVLGAE